MVPGCVTVHSAWIGIPTLVFPTLGALDLHAQLQ